MQKWNPGQLPYLDWESKPLGGPFLWIQVSNPCYMQVLIWHSRSSKWSLLLKTQICGYIKSSDTWPKVSLFNLHKWPAHVNYCHPKPTKPSPPHQKQIHFRRSQFNFESNHRGLGICQRNLNSGDEAFHLGLVFTLQRAVASPWKRFFRPQSLHCIRTGLLCPSYEQRATYSG